MLSRVLYSGIIISFHPLLEHDILFTDSEVGKCVLHVVSHHQRKSLGHVFLSGYGIDNEGKLMISSV